MGESLATAVMVVHLCRPWNSLEVKKLAPSLRRQRIVVLLQLLSAE